MCLLICAPKGRIDDDEVLENGFCNNSDGAGFTFAYNKKLIVKKGYFHFDDFIKEYRQIPEGAPNLVHFRLATSGQYNEENCHPFNVSERLAFAHNGVFHCVLGDAIFSDTHYFNEKVLKPVFSGNPRLALTDAANLMLRETIGSGNKIAFLNHLGETSIVNERAGDWTDEVWFSNSSWLYARSRTTNWPVAKTCAPTQLKLTDVTNLLTPHEQQNRGNGRTWKEFLVGCYRSHIQEQASELSR